MHQQLQKLALVVLFALPGVAAACKFTPMPIEPEFADKRETFVGRQGATLVRFHNERADGEVTVFPEPPLEIEDTQARSSCTIDDGGVWVRHSVHLSGNRRVLLTEEYSGSSTQLNFYSTSTCKRLSSIDVSNAKWALDGRFITLTPVDAGPSSPKPKQYRLEANCLPNPGARPR
ncbi:hypothetical protein [Eleftheria terrae]|uniref:hypothetical protein n=1 Tax=Eleftheria terrae TaxID=1597781 RepID=UPI00263AB277|nr:hypothetical protein [Eleftheria terrae]WKB51490.1 hypothetical protein N7L95_16990 [Eleftheria terrae]